MRIIDYAKGNVLPEYTDGGVRESCGPERADQLLELPPEWRQNAMAAAYQRAYAVETVIRVDGRLLEGGPAPRPDTNFETELEHVIEEIKASLRSA